MVENFPHQEHDFWPKEKTRFKDFKAAYRAVLGFEYPQSPEQLPTEFTLSPAAYGKLIEAIVAQQTIDVPSGFPPRERAQIVGLLNYSNQLTDSRVTVGTEMRAKNAPITLGRWFRPFIGLSAKPLHYWHTHSPKHSRFPTIDDVLHPLSEDREGAIYTVGSQTEITVIMQSAKALPRFFPQLQMGSTFYKALYQEFDKVKVLFDDSEEEIPLFPELAAYLESKGLGLYRWVREDNQSVMEAAQKDIFAKGIHLKKVT